MAELRLPPSDVVNPCEPYVATVELDAALGDEEGTAAVRLRRADPGLPGGDVVATVAFGPCCGARQIEIRVNAGALAEGEYVGDVTLVAGGLRESWPVAFFRPAGPRPSTIPFGVYAMPFGDSAEGVDTLLADVAATGIDLICQHMHDGVGPYRAILDRAARFGLRFRPSVNVPRTGWPEALACRLNGDPGEGAATPPCRANPAVRRVAVQTLQQQLREFRTHVAFSGTIYYGDDLFLPLRCQQGTAAIACYCAHCQADFEQRYGRQPPTSTELRRGVVAEDDPWLVWMRHRCGESYGGLVAAIEEAKDAVDSSIAVGLCHGWPDNPFVSVVSGLYGPLTQPTDVVSSYCYPFLRSPAQDLICHYEIAKMGNREKDVWMLGLCAADHTMAPAWQVCQNYWNMLAAGYKSIAFFSWWDYGKILEDGSADDHRRQAESQAALARCGRHKDWILPTAQFWGDPPARVAALYSFTTEAFDVAPDYHGHRHSKRVCELYRLALRRCLPMAIVCEEEIRDGILDRLDAVCLHDVRALPGDIKVMLDAYAGGGKTVLADSDYLYTDAWHPAVKVGVEGAVEMAAESMVEVLRDRVQPPVEVGNADVTVRHFLADEVEYFVFVNNYADRYHGMTYSYGDRAANYARAALVRDEVVRATVRFSGATRHLFDLSTGGSVGCTESLLNLLLEPSWGCVLAALASPCADLHVDPADGVRQGATVHWRLTVLDGNGHVLRGAFTVNVCVKTPSGRRSRYSGFLGIDGGVGEFILPIGCNDEVGSWRLTFEGGFPRRLVERRLAVSLGDEPSVVEVEVRAC